MPRVGGIGWRRAAMAAAALPFAAMTVAGVPVARAQDASGTPPKTVSRIATADATALRIVPTIGALDVGIDVGSSSSKLENRLAQAQSATVNAGLLPILFTAGECPALEPLAAAGGAIAPTRAENREGDQRAANDHSLPTGSLVTASREEAEASTDPLAAVALTQTGAVLPGVVSVHGAVARASSEELDDGTYRARAAVDASLQLAGAIDLGGLTWTAEHVADGETGAGHADFTVGSASVAGVALPVDDTASLGRVLNQVLGAVGITLEFPARSSGPDVEGRSTVGPLRLTFKAPTGTNMLLGTLLDPLGSSVMPVADLLRQVSCALGPALLGSDIVLTIARGNGSVALEIGGATAAAGTRTFDNAFGDGSAAAAVNGAPALRPSGAPPAALGVVPLAPTSHDQLVLGAAPMTATRCATTHPFGRPGCGDGKGVLAGLLGLATIGGLAVLDVRHQRRTGQTDTG